jgi:drug/metabolite transporter (DMT)-like permease
METSIWIILIVALCGILGATGQIFFKLAADSLEWNLPSIMTNWKLIIGLILYGLATILFILTLKKGNLSTLYPIIATSYIWVALFSKIYLKEAFPGYKWIAILFIIVGIVIIVKD